MNDKRNKRIKELRLKYSLAEIAKRYNLSPERIRQITSPDQSAYCTKHSRRYNSKGACSLCYITNYYHEVLTNGQVDEEINFLKSKDRRLEAVFMRTLLIKHLRDQRQMSFPQIGRLLDRDHTSIINLYYKNL